MQTTAMKDMPEKSRNLLFLTTPDLWGLWPFLPLVRRREGQEQELGVLFDALHCCGVAGFSASVIFTNLFLLPQTPD